MHPRTREQLRALSLAFYEAHAQGFDASRAELPWPGWERIVPLLPKRPLSVLDIGCGNGRFARYLHAARRSDGTGLEFDYVGTDASEALLEAARARVPSDAAPHCQWRVHDFLESETPGDDLPAGPFSLVVLMGVLHHVPGSEARLALLRAAARRVEPEGLLVFTAWQFASRPRFDRRRVEWSTLGPVRGEAIDVGRLEAGDHLLRFGDDPKAPPRYCHQVSDEEFATWTGALGLEAIADYRADGAEGDLNRYGIFRRAASG